MPIIRWRHYNLRAINYANHCTLLQRDTDGIHGWCAANFMKSNISKTTIIAFTWKQMFFIMFMK
jgi:hypothetical protein